MVTDDLFLVVVISSFAENHHLGISVGMYGFCVSQFFGIYRTVSSCDLSSTVGIEGDFLWTMGIILDANFMVGKPRHHGWKAQNYTEITSIGHPPILGLSPN